MVLHRAHLLTFYLKVDILFFAQEKISFYLFFFRVNHRVHFFLPHRVQLLFSYGAPSSVPFYFHLKGGVAQFAAVKIFSIRIFFCYPSNALFSAPLCADIILNGAPLSAPAYFLLKSWYTSFFLE